MDERTEYITKESLVAFFDILGYTQIVKTNYIPESLFIQIIKYITEKVRCIEQYSMSETEWNWKVYSFSDNFAVVVSFQEAGFFSACEQLFWTLQIIQVEIASLFGVLIRGGITKGKIYAGDNFIYGPALIRAYEIESEIAIYPRLVIDKLLISELTGLTGMEPEHLFLNFGELLYEDMKSSSEFTTDMLNALEELNQGSELIVMQEDFDGQYYLDSFQYLYYLIKYQHDKKEFNRCLLDLGAHLYEYIDIYGNSERLLKKYFWVCISINKFLDSVGLTRMFTEESLLDIGNINIRDIETVDEVLKFFLSELMN